MLQVRAFRNKLERVNSPERFLKDRPYELGGGRPQSEPSSLFTTASSLITSQEDLEQISEDPTPK